MVSEGKYRKRNIKKRLGCLLLAGVLLLSMVGCGSFEQKEPDEPVEIVPTGELVPFAEFQEVKLELSSLEQYVWTGTSFVYLVNEWMDEEETTRSTLWRAAADGSGQPEQIYQNVVGEPFIYLFTMDLNENFYLLQNGKGEDQKTQRYLCKLDKDMQEVYKIPLEDAAFTGDALFFCDLVVNGNGNVVLTDYSQNAYFFDNAGNYMGKQMLAAQFYQGNFIDAGEQGCFFWQMDWDTSEIFVQKVDFEKALLKEPENLSIASLAGAEAFNSGNYNLISGYEKGILLSAKNALWQYDINTGEAAELLSWQDSNINIIGTSVEKMFFLPEEGQDASKQSMKVLCYDGYSGVAEIADITYIDRAYIPEKQTIVLGTIVPYVPSLTDWVNTFNRESTEYFVVIKEYGDMEELTEELLFQQEEFPDIFDVSQISAEMLNSKKLLEDLEPYFQKSEVVNKDDILEQVWDACYYDEKLTSIMCGFHFVTCMSTAEGIPTDGWSYEEFFAMDEEYPDSRPFQYYNEVNVWNFLSYTGVNDYIDWDKNKCYFDSEEFRVFIEHIKNANYKEEFRAPAEGQTVFHMDDIIQAFVSGEFLLKTDTYGAPYSYQSTKLKYRGKVKQVGFPTKDGELCCIMSPLQKLAIYKDSANKEGAWAFLEYILSEDNQSWYGMEVSAFPVRKEAFEAYLTKPYSRVRSFVGDNPSEETAAVFREMLEHIQPEQGIHNVTITNILSEELQAYYAGDKTVEEATAIIQSRVQLYLDENF